MNIEENFTFSNRHDENICPQQLSYFLSGQWERISIINAKIRKHLKKDRTKGVHGTLGIIQLSSIALELIMIMLEQRAVLFISATSGSTVSIKHYPLGYLVFKGPVWSGYMVFRDTNRDQDRLAFLPELKKTGLDRK